MGTGLPYKTIARHKLQGNKWMVTQTVTPVPHLGIHCTLSKTNATLHLNTAHCGRQGIEEFFS